MQTERVTYLTSAEHKAALEAFAKARGESVGHVVREATASYIAQPPEQKDEHEEALDLLIPALEAMLAKWSRQMDSMESDLKRASDSVDRALEGDLQ